MLKRRALFFWVKQRLGWARSVPNDGQWQFVDPQRLGVSIDFDVGIDSPNVNRIVRIRNDHCANSRDVWIRICGIAISNDTDDGIRISCFINNGSSSGIISARTIGIASDCGIGIGINSVYIHNINNRDNH